MYRKMSCLINRVKFITGYLRSNHKSSEQKILVKKKQEISHN